MKKKLILISILLLVGPTLSGCFLPPPPIEGGGHSRGYGYYGHSRGHGDWDRDHHGSGRDYRYWR